MELNFDRGFRSKHNTSSQSVIFFLHGGNDFEVFHEFRNYDFDLDVSRFLTDASTNSAWEGNVGEAVAAGAVLWQESIGVKSFGIFKTVGIVKDVV